MTDSDEFIKKLQSIVEQTIKEEKSIVEKLLNEPVENLTKGEQISDKVAKFGGSWSFIIWFAVVLVCWIIYNSLSSKSFDPYPFILMNLILSCVAALQAPIIMMSQNRQEQKDRKRSENDYLINLKAELEIRSLHQKLDLLVQEQIKLLNDNQALQTASLTEIKNRIDKIEHR